MNGVRFAPSPTGRFHVGNLRTAWISAHIARALDEPWIVRFEDIDVPRVLSGSEESQVRDLRELGLIPDLVYRQSSNAQRHFDLFARARAEGAAYACDCSRKVIQDDLAKMASAPHAHQASYSGRCRDRKDVAPNAQTGWRFRMADSSGRDDLLIARGDGASLATYAPSYHWACAVDDGDGDHRLLVRASDLKPAAIAQRAIQTWGGLPMPALLHTALVVQEDGHRLEKRTRGATLDEIDKQRMFEWLDSSSRLVIAEAACTKAGTDVNELPDTLIWQMA